MVRSDPVWLLSWSAMDDRRLQLESLLWNSCIEVVNSTKYVFSVSELQQCRCSNVCLIDLVLIAVEDQVSDRTGARVSLGPNAVLLRA